MEWARVMGRIRVPSTGLTERSDFGKTQSRTLTIAKGTSYLETLENNQIGCCRELFRGYRLTKHVKPAN